MTETTFVTTFRTRDFIEYTTDGKKRIAIIVSISNDGQRIVIDDGDGAKWLNKKEFADLNAGYVALISVVALANAGLET